MHRRASHRYPAVFTVILYQHGHPIVTCHAENVSRDGMFIKTSNVELRNDAGLEIEFESPDGEHSQYARLPVSLAHISNHGLGLKFAEPTTREQILAHALLGYANRRFRVYRNAENTNAMQSA